MARNGGERVGQYMQVSGFQIEVRAVMMMVMIAVCVMVVLFQQERAEQIDDEADDGHQDGLVVGDGRGGNQPQQGFIGHDQG